MSVLGESVQVVNSFEDATITSGKQAVYGSSSATVVDPGVELPAFVGFYDIDVSADKIKMTLVNNSGATSLVIPDGRYDRYYFGFSSKFVLAKLDGANGLNAKARVRPVAPGQTLDLVDQFGTGVVLPVSFPNGGFVLEIGPGTDLTTLGQTVDIKLIGAATPPSGSSTPK